MSSLCLSCLFLSICHAHIHCHIFTDWCEFAQPSSILSPLALQLICVSSSTSVFHGCLGSFDLSDSLYLSSSGGLLSPASELRRAAAVIARAGSVPLKVPWENQTHNFISDPTSSLISRTSCTPIAGFSYLPLFNECWQRDRHPKPFLKLVFLSVKHCHSVFTDIFSYPISTDKYCSFVIYVFETDWQEKNTFIIQWKADFFKWFFGIGYNLCVDRFPLVLLTD